MNEELITQAEFARRHGVSRQAVGDLVSRGVITLVDGKVDERAALHAIANVRDPARAGKIIAGPEAEMTVADVLKPPSGDGQGDLPTPEEAGAFHAAKTRREKAEASIAELKLQQLAGSLVDKGTTWQAITDATALLQSAVDRIADKLAERVAAESNSDACYRLIKTETDAVLRDVADAVRRMGSKLDGAVEQPGPVR